MLASVKNDKVKIGDNLRIVREEKKLTQEQLAEKMDVDKQTVYRMEKGNYSIETFLAAMLVLEVNLQDLLPKRYVHIEAEKSESQVDKICKEIRQMPEQDQVFVVGAMQNAKEYLEFTKKQKH